MPQQQATQCDSPSVGGIDTSVSPSLRVAWWRVVSPALLLCLLSNCGSISNFGPHLIIPPDTVKLESARDTFIMLGARLPREGSKLTAANFMLYTNGNRQLPKGIVVPGVYGDSVTSSAGGSSIYDDTTYVETDAGRHAYRIWRIPNDQLVAGTPLRVFIFVASVRAGGNIWGPFKMNQWPVPSKPWPIEWSQANSDAYFFTGAVLDISSPGVYYLGDVELSGFVRDKTQGSERTIIAAVNTNVRADAAAAHAYFFRQSGLPSFPYFDGSTAWQKLPGSEFSTFLGGSMPDGWKPPVAAPAGVESQPLRPPSSPAPAFGGASSSQE